MYISKQDRTRLDPLIDKVIVVTSPELSYCIAQMSLNHLEIIGLNDLTINSVLGAMERAKIEFYNRIASTLDVHTIRKNGDLFHEFIRRRNI